MWTIASSRFVHLRKPQASFQHIFWASNSAVVGQLGHGHSPWLMALCSLLQSVDRAHNSLKAGSLEYAYGELLGANINRSPTSYLKNPAEERALYKHDVDKEMTLLKVLDQEGGRCISPSLLSALQLGEGALSPPRLSNMTIRLPLSPILTEPVALCFRCPLEPHRLVPPGLIDSLHELPTNHMCADPRSCFEGEFPTHIDSRSGTCAGVGVPWPGSRCTAPPSTTPTS